MEPFTFKKINFDDNVLMEKIYRLRFQVYCLECGFIKAQDYPDGIEMDEYDPQSVHFAAFDQNGEVVGTMRLILPGPCPLPIQCHCPGLDIPGDLTSSNNGGCAEISRLVISKQLRRRRDDGMYYEPQVDDRKVVDSIKNEFFRRAKPMAFGLYREMYHESKCRGISRWYALMEKSLWLLLRIHGFHFDCIGEQVDVYGPVNPYVGFLPVIETDLRAKFPKFYEYFAGKSDVLPRGLAGNAEEMKSADR